MNTTTKEATMPTIAWDAHKRFCSDTLTTAIEGGINYWALGRKFLRVDEDAEEMALCYLGCEIKPDPAEGAAFDQGDKRNGWQAITLDSIAAAVALILSDAGKGLLRKDIREDILIDWNDADACRSDAETADVIVQIALFGEIVFG